MRGRGFDAVGGLLPRVRSFWRGITRRSAVEADMSEEFRHHLDLRAEDLVRGGVPPREAIRQARLEFGHPEKHAQEGRAARGLRSVDELRFSWLDVKLGIRMLVRYPGLTVVGGLAMAFAICMGAGTFEFVRQLTHPTLPFPEGERIVGLVYSDATQTGQEQATPYDVVALREQVTALEEVGGFRTLQTNLAVGEAGGEPVQIAQISASAFRTVRVPPLLGRTLIEEDEAPGAAAVVVLGHRLWRARFGGDPGVVGRMVRLGDVRAAVVGVMPEGFAFPVDHDLWMPLDLAELLAPPGQGPSLPVFGRLAPGATLSSAGAEVMTVTRRAAAVDPERYRHMTVRVVPYAESILGFAADDIFARAGMYSINLLAALFLVLICGNVALLIFARAATREREILLRNALGASRRRIVAQLFVEALVLGLLAALLGLAAAQLAMRWAMNALAAAADFMPFWIAPAVSPATVGYAALLTVLAAAVAGVVPALKVTGRGMEARLRQGATGGGGLRLGGIWTVVIVAQIAATVVFTAFAYVMHREAIRGSALAAGFDAGEYLVARVEMDRENLAGVAGADTAAGAFLQRYTEQVREIERRLTALPGVERVTIADLFPRMKHPYRYVEIDEGGAEAASSEGDYTVSSAGVALDFFETFQVPMLAGRSLDARDLDEGVRTVIVNRSFVDQVLGARNPIGRRIRYRGRGEWDEPRGYRDEPGPWYEIVGVVPDLVLPYTPTSLDLEDPPTAQLFHPLSPTRARSYPLHIAAHVGSDPATMAPVLRRVAGEVDPHLRLHDVQPLDQLTTADAQFFGFWADFILLTSAIALVLSLAGIYAVMSFTVSRRRREIGIRVAMGAVAPRVVAEIFRRPLAHLVLGVVLGCIPLVGLIVGLRARVTVQDAALVLGYAAVMTAVCALACIGPTLRALRVEPAEALASEG